MDSYMWNNIALAERCLRASSGFFTIFYLLLVPGFPMIFAFAYLISLYLLLTALIAWDPLYSIFYKATKLLKITGSKPNNALVENHQFAMG